MASLFRSAARALSDRWVANRDPAGFARSIGVRINGNVTFYGINRAMFGSEPWMISIGDNVYVTAGVQFITHDGGTLILRKDFPDLEWTAPISVGDDVYIGLRSLVLPGVSIGNRSIIGAGSIVTRDVPPNTVVAGVPARSLMTVDDYLAKMKAKSLGFGNLPADAKADRIKTHYGIA